VSPRAVKVKIMQAFLCSVKSLTLEAEKDRVLGFEPVTKFLPAARPKSGINLVHDTQHYKTDDTWHIPAPNKGAAVMKSYYLGIDVSKGYADFVIVDKQKQPVVKNFQLDDTFDGHSHLYQILGLFFTEHRNSTVYCAVESTGGYENNWYNALTKFQASLNIKVARLNPAAVFNNSKAGLKRNTTDKISAQNVAEYLVSHPEKVVYQQHDQMASLRKQWGFIQMLTKQCTQLLNQINNLLYTANPELLLFCRDGMPIWVLKLLLKYPTSGQLKKARAKTLTKIPYVTMPRAQQLIANAKRSVASATDPITAQLIGATARQILHLKKTIATQDKLMAADCDLPEVDLLKTFIGIGDASAIGLILEIQSVARFPKAKNLASFWGLHPVYKISGDGSGGFKMSKKGRKQPRKILFTVTLTATEHNPVIKELFQYQLARGKEKMDAIGICMHKILRIIYGMLKNKTAFDPKIDATNKMRRVSAKMVNTKSKSDRRFQCYDANAPVSGRQQKKRVEREQSHSVNDTKHGISAPVPIGNIIANTLAKL
jgi:transposase